MEPYRIAVRRSWMRGGLAQGRSILVRLPPLTQLRLGSKLPSLRSPLPHGRGIAGLQSELSMFPLPFTGGG